MEHLLLKALRLLWETITMVVGTQENPLGYIIVCFGWSNTEDASYA